MEWRNVNRMLTKSERPRTLDPSGSGLPSLSRRSGHNISHRRATSDSSHSATTSGRDLGIKALIDWDSLKTEHSAQPLMQSHLLQTPEHEPTQPSTTSTRSENNRKAVLPCANSNQPCDKVLCPHELSLATKCCVRTSCSSVAGKQQQRSELPGVLMNNGEHLAGRAMQSPGNSRGSAQNAFISNSAEVPSV